MKNSIRRHASIRQVSPHLMGWASLLSCRRPSRLRDFLRLPFWSRLGCTGWSALILPLAALAAAAPPTVRLSEELPAAAMTVTASSEYSPGQTARHLVDGSGMRNGRHDNNHSAQTMWHTTQFPVASSPAAGVPASPAWVRFDFAQPQAFDSILLWNHNQGNLTDRGFRKTRILGSVDGAKWLSLTSPEVLELPRAGGSPGLEPIVIPNLKKAQALKSVIIAAEAKDGNFGGDYYGLSAVRFAANREVAEADLPVPTGMACAGLPYAPYRPDGKPGREIAITLKDAKLYGKVSIVVECAGAREETNLPGTPRGAEHFSVFMPATAGITNECEATIKLRSGRTALEQTITVPGCKPRVYYVLMHSHCDIGYTDIQPHIAAKQAQNVVHALELIEQTKNYPKDSQFKWNTEGFWQVEQFYKIATAKQKAAFEQAVRERRICVDGMYGNLLTGLARGEELLRQLEFSAELGQRCGVRCESMMISDVPGLIWGTVPALAQAGIRYISDGPNASRGMIGDRIGYVRVRYENHPFWWVSPSGQERALYWGAQGGYSIGHHCASLRDAVAELTDQLEELGYPYDIVQLRWTKGDNGGPDETVMPIVRDWNKQYAWPKLVISTTAEMFHAFEKRYGDQLPVLRGDMTPYWEDGAPSSARETGINRLASDRMTQGEILWTLLQPKALPAAGYEEALKNIAMYSEHTWGAHNSISAPDLEFVKAQWKIKQAFALDGESQTEKMLADALATRGSCAEPVAAIDVYNTACWPRTDLVTLPATMKVAGDVVKNQAGDIMPSQRLSSGELAFIARDVPPFGGRRFTLEAGATKAAGAARAEGAALADSSLAVKLDPLSGAIASLRAGGLDHEFVDAGAELGLNGYLYLPGGNVKDAQPNGPAKITVKENGPLVASLLVESEAPGCHQLLREIRLVDGLGRVDLIDTLDKKAIRSVEGVHLGFGFNVADPVLHINIPWAVIQPEKDQLDGACKNWFCVERWVDISNDKLGVTWSTVEAPLIEIGGLTANLPRSQPNPRAYMSSIKPSAKIYSWVMNNHWHTNYRADQEGKTVFRYAIRPHAAYDQVAAAHFGTESTEPLIAAPAAGAAPALPPVEISSGPILLTSLKPSHDGKALILRLYNTGDTEGHASLKWNGVAPKAISVSDLLEQAGAPASATVALPAYEVRTLRVDLR